MRLLVASALVLLLGSQSLATSIAPKHPLLEEIARRNEKVPTSIGIAAGVLEERPGGPDRHISLSAAQRSLLRRLVEAHKKNGVAAFREALHSEHPWMQQIALDALPQGRIATGFAGAQFAKEAARREDAAFVADFLPELRTLACAPFAPKDAVRLQPRSCMAQDCLGFLAQRAHDDATAKMALTDLADGVASRPTRSGFQALAETLEARPALELTADQKKALVPAVRAAMRAWLDYPKHDSPLVTVDVPALAARLDDAETLDLVSQVFWKVKRYDFVHHLARGGHPRAVEATRHVLRGSRGVVYAREYVAAGLLRDASLVPDIEDRMARKGTRKAALDALLAIGTPSAFVAIERRLEADIRSARERGHGVELSADAWLRTNPPDPERLRKHIKTLPGIARTSLLLAMAKNGATDLFPAIRSYLVKPTIPIDVQMAALRALGQHLKHSKDPIALSFLLEKAHDALRAWTAEAPDHDAAKLWQAAVRALAMHGSVEGEPDRWMHEYVGVWWPFESGRGRIVELLGHVGGERTLAFLRPLCEYPQEPKPYAGTYTREAARTAVGRIEARLAK